MNPIKQKALNAGFKIDDRHGEIRISVRGLSYLFESWAEVSDYLQRAEIPRQRKASKPKAKRATKKTSNNPASRDDIAAARSLASRFHGRAPDDDELYRVSKPHIPDALANIGQVFAIEYLAERDGKVYRFRHAFRAKSRPQLAVSPDGNFVTLIGGSWQFSEDGFIDQ